MDITIGKYKISSDTYQFIVSETKVKTGGENKGDKYDTNQQFFPTLASALNNLVGKKLRESDATTLS